MRQMYDNMRDTVIESIANYLSNNIRNLLIVPIEIIAKNHRK